MNGAVVPTHPEDRVLFLAPTSKDGRITQSLLAGEQVNCVICESLGAIGREVRTGVAAVLMTEEAVTDEGVVALLDALRDQPPWSDVPVVILMRGGGSSPRAMQVLRELTNVTLLERPAPMRSVVSAVKAAIRGRQRQYELRGLLERERAARIELERVGRMKDEFLATLSHELRTPLNAILGWSQLMNTSADDSETMQEGLAVIERNARAQVQLIEDLLDMSRIISGNIRINMRPIDPSAVIAAAIETVSPAAEAKGITLRSHVHPSVGAITGDPNRLQQVIWNLLSNAIKFTPQGGEVSVEATTTKGNELQVRITDTGEGIKPEFLPHVFERFRQADASTTRAVGGLGLGLAIVKSLVELHGGTVTAESGGVGQGSRFTVRLPIVGASAEPNHPSTLASRPSIATRQRSTASLVGTRVLVVDDDDDARRLIKRILEDCDATVLTASSAREALDLFESRSPDVLVSDIGMPMVDGYQLLRNIRTVETNRGQPHIPAIALTAFASADDRSRAMKAGYGVHITKPVEPHEVVATIISVTGRSDALTH